MKVHLTESEMEILLACLAHMTRTIDDEYQDFTPLMKKLERKYRGYKIRGRN